MSSAFCSSVLEFLPFHSPHLLAAEDTNKNTSLQLHDDGFLTQSSFFFLFFPYSLDSCVLVLFSCTHETSERRRCGNTTTNRIGVKLNFVQCVGCALVLVYKSKTGTASLLRHRCSKFPISVYDLKLAAAGHPIDLLGNMEASSGNGETIEMKQEMLSDDECLDLQDINDDNDQQFTNDQTNKGLMVSFSLLERSLVTGDDSLLTREEIVAAQRTNDPDLYFERLI